MCSDEKTTFEAVVMYLNLLIAIVHLWWFAPNFAKVIESVIVDEKTWFGVLNTHIYSFVEPSRFHHYTFQGLSLWYVCSFCNLPYCIEITRNFQQVIKSMPFHEKSKFQAVVICSRHVLIVHLCF